MKVKEGLHKISRKLFIGLKKPLNWKIHETLTLSKDTSDFGMLGLMYFYGLGVNQDYEQAFYWAQQSADQENAISAQYCRFFVSERPRS